MTEWAEAEGEVLAFKLRVMVETDREVDAYATVGRLAHRLGVPLTVAECAPYWKIPAWYSVLAVHRFAADLPGARAGAVTVARGLMERLGTGWTVDEAAREDDVVIFEGLKAPAAGGEPFADPAVRWAHVFLVREAVAERQMSEFEAPDGPA